MSQEMTETELAIIGGGPIGIEAALHARNRGWDLHLFERDRIGAHVSDWSHVQLFSPWRLNRSRWGVESLRERDIELAAAEEYPTGEEYLDRYLRPLASSPPLEGRIHEGTEVYGVARRDALKTEHIGAEERADSPFVLRVGDGEREEFVRAGAVIDATGSYRTPNGLGPGGLRARGEKAHRDDIEYHIPDVLDAERETYAGRETVVVGAGYSAVTTLRALQRLRSEAPETAITWCLRSDSEPYSLIPDDPLPMRRELSEFGNAAARNEIPEIDVVSGTILSVRRPDSGGFELGLDGDDGPFEIRADRVVANVGYRPDLDLFRELQVHECWATEGPIDLAASLLAADGGADCLEQSSAGVEQLNHPEPDFFVLGSKSYGRNSTFLLDVGFDQIEQTFDALTRSELPA